MGPEPSTQGGEEGHGNEYRHSHHDCLQSLPCQLPYPLAAHLAFPRAGVRPLFDLFRLLHPQERTFMAMPPFVCF